MRTTNRSITLATIGVALATMSFATDRHVPTEYPTIQAAVDASADGDTIHIAAGVYVEQISFSRKNLTLIGEPGAILRAFPNMEDATPSNNSRCILFILLSPNVVVKNLTFEGDQLADQQGSANNVIGVYHLDSGGAVENCRFTGFRERVAGDGRGRAIRCRNDLPGAPLYAYQAIGNTIEDSYVGMEIAGAPDTLSLEVILENNIIRGVGPSENTANKRGMDLGEGITGSVTGNSISGFSYSGAGAQYPWGWGIFAAGDGWPFHRPLDPIVFENNTLTDNNLHLVLSKGDDCEVINNRFEGTGPGLSEAGLWFGGVDVEVRGNTFRDMPTGMIVGGQDPILGTDLGFAVNAVLTDNRFRDVDTAIWHQPSAIATETGTLTYPYPEPDLNLVRAVRLSWPDYNDDYVLECATDPNGPWTPVAETLRQEGETLVTFLRTDGERKLFRLRKP